MNVTRERLTLDLISELEMLLDDNHGETGHLPNLNINWDWYLALQDSLNIFTLRDDENQIVGVMAVYVGPYPHDVETLYAEQITYYIVPRYRRWSIKMMVYSETYCRELGCEIFIQSARIDTPFCKTLKRRKYEPVDVRFMKRL